jgi:predicted CXXCH cytochrome family protein
MKTGSKAVLGSTKWTLVSALLFHFFLGSGAWAGHRDGLAMAAVLESPFATSFPEQGPSPMQRVYIEYAVVTVGGHNYCEYCHVPQAQLGGGAPRWQTSGAGHGIRCCVLYRGALAGHVGSDAAELSLICLSCHDGAIGPDSYGRSLGEMSARGDHLLAGGHPVSVGFSPGRDLRRFNAAGKASATGVETRFAPGELLRGDRVECVSCHDVHAADSGPYMLRAHATPTEMCVSCHPR